MSKTLDIKEYVKTDYYRNAMGLPVECTEKYSALANGEYNINYDFVHPITGKRLVLRVNAGSQMHLNHQIEYEAMALKLLANSGRTPEVYYVDGSDDAPGNGVLVEAFMPGGPLDIYRDDHRMRVAGCLADIHSVYIDKNLTIDSNPESVDPDTTMLIAPVTSMRAILEECESMLGIYLDSEIPEESMKRRLRLLLDKAWKLIPEEEVSPYRCCINTEVNSTNYIVGDDGRVSLVDWEKPLYGDPAQDLGHFLAPTTTFWKTDLVLSQTQVEEFLEEYIRCVDNRFDTSGVVERTLAFIPVTCLRGITWCAQAWIEYQSPDRALMVQSTHVKIKQYLSEDFLSGIERRIDRAIKSMEEGR